MCREDDSNTRLRVPTGVNTASVGAEISKIPRSPIFSDGSKQGDQDVKVTCFYLKKFWKKPSYSQNKYTFLYNLRIAKKKRKKTLILFLSKSFWDCKWNCDFSSGKKYLSIFNF